MMKIIFLTDLNIQIDQNRNSDSKKDFLYLETL